MPDLPQRDPLASYDRLGRKQPKRLGFIELVRGMPSLLSHFTREVPSGRCEMDPDGAIIVTCRCGTDAPPRVPFNAIVPCHGEGCGRFFFYDGERVRVARDPSQTDPQTPVVD